MKFPTNSDREVKILCSLSSLPRKLLSLEGRDDAAAFMLCELADENCFDLKQAAFLVDNPDFNCLKGVAGISRNECGCSAQEIWRDTAKFGQYLCEQPFHKKVRSFGSDSCCISGSSDDLVIKQVGYELGMKSPGLVSWNMKYGNRGILLYECAESDGSCQLLSDGVCLLSFCPI